MNEIKKKNNDLVQLLLILSYTWHQTVVAQLQRQSRDVLTYSSSRSIKLMSCELMPTFRSFVTQDVLQWNIKFC